MTLFADFDSDDRRHLFMFACIPTRILIVALLAQFPGALRFPALLFAAASLEQTVSLRNEGVWWSRRTHAVTSALLILAALFSPTKMWLVAFIDLAFGAGRALYVNPFV